MTIAAPLGLDAAQRSTLERLVSRARSLLEDDLAAQAEGRFGIHRDGTIEDEAALPEDTSDKITRRDLEQIVVHLRALGEDAPSAVARLLREAAFTHLNRLVAIRIAEAIGLLPESLGAGPQSRGFKDLGEIMPMLAGDYRAYVRLCGDELAADAPALFDPRNPLLALEPSTAAFDELVGFVADPEEAEIWLAPDTLGWAYQFFNTGDERREMREASAPRNSRELAVRNQFFTPRYVVDFLVQNTIGRRLIENDPTSSLLEELPLLVDPPTEPGSSLDLKEVKCLDPACGSGHFLLGCYDVLERAWELAGVAPSESAPKIVASLWGVDIDARCAQVASAAIVLRARRHCRNLVLPRPNIVTARGLPGGSAALPPGLQLSDGQRSLIDRASEVLADAPLLGTLLKAEVALDEEIRHGVFGGKLGRSPGMLELTEEAAEATERELLDHLQAIADLASSSVVERLLAAEADDALRLVEVVRQRYDTVLMNPPFGEPVPSTKAYLRAAYPWIPTQDYNLLAAFVGRGIELCKPGGYLGALTGRAGMFLTGSERWRREVLLGHRLVTLADLGYGVMEQAQIEAAAYVIQAERAAHHHSATFIRMLKDTDRSNGLGRAIAALRAGVDDRRIFRVRIGDLEAVPGIPVAYWMTPSIRSLFVGLPALEGSGAEARVGLQSGEDFRFVRTFWEIAPERVARSRDETRTGRRWCPFGKGGEYSPYWADINLVVDWEEDGQRVREHSGSRPQNLQYFFRAGLTWPDRGTALAPRVLPAGTVFSSVGMGCFPLGDPLVCLAWLNTRLARKLADVMVSVGEEAQAAGGSPHYFVGIVQRVPWPGDDLSPESVTQIRAACERLVELRLVDDLSDETTRRFIGPSAVRTRQGIRASAASLSEGRMERALEALDLSASVERVFSTAMHLGQDALEVVDEESGIDPVTLPQTELSPAEEKDLERLMGLSLPSLITECIERAGGSRSVAAKAHVVDRRIEVLSQALRRHPRVVVDAIRRGGWIDPGQARRLADEVISYCVGAAFGRWDIQVALDPARAPSSPTIFEPVALCPPAMLVNAEQYPAREGPVGYPLVLPPGRLLVDEPGHPWDIEAALLTVEEALFDEAPDVLAEMLQILGRKTIRDHLRKQFFKDHVARYSASRRKAPIYWPLTVPSKSWGVWVYAPMLTRETLYAVASEAGRRERLSVEGIARLQREQQDGGTERPARMVAEELDAEERLAEELRRFRAEAERVAGLGWEPDLDDGIVLCAAPLADLFPSWPDAMTARTELRRGKYEWAGVAAWSDQL